MKRFLLLLAVSSLLFINQSNAQGSPWITQNSGLAAAPWYDVRLAAVSNTVCWGLHFRTGSQYTRTTDGGVQWTAGTIPGAPASWRGSGITALDANTAWVLMHDPSSPTSGGVFKTTDGGASWTHQTTAFPGTGGFPRVIHFFDANVGLCVGDANGGYWEIYRTTNGGVQWTRIDSVNIPLPDPGETTFFFGSSASNSFLFSGGDGGFSFWHLYRTTDRGLTWVRRDPGGGTRFPTFASTTHGICAGWVPSQEMRRTTDGGDTWSTEDMSFLPFTPLLFGYVPGAVNSYVLTNGVRSGFSSTAGCAYTTNGGDTWNNVDLGVSRGLSSFASPTTGWSPGDFGTVYKWTGNLLVTSVQQTNEVVHGFRLEQNYPNPFNPSTRIPFSVRGSGFVSLKVYDILGREVRALVNDKLQPGSYEVTFDATGLASGVYFYRLTAGEFTESKRMVLLR